MNNIIWLFPILFLIHELEEILGFEKWYSKNKNKLNKYPVIAKNVDNMFSYFTTKGMLFAIFEQLILCLLVCIIAVKYDFNILWLGAFIGYTIHLIIHFFQSVILKTYIPSFITSVVEIPVCFYIIYFVFNHYDFLIYKVFYYSVIATIIIALNLYLVHKIMRRIH